MSSGSLCCVRPGSGASTTSTAGGFRKRSRRACARAHDERLLLLEHDPVYTIGRRGTTDHLLAGFGELRRAGASVYRVDRGGDITYHGPGQLVGYPVVRLGDPPDPVRYVRAVEGALVDLLASYRVAARTERGKTGVWVDLPDSGVPAKIAAIGVRVSRGVTTHGFALNVRTDLAAFARMIPCGFAHEIASLERLGRECRRARRRRARCHGVRGAARPASRMVRCRARARRRDRSGRAGAVGGGSGAGSGGGLGSSCAPCPWCRARG